VQWLVGALIITVSGTFGDLSESLLKRKYNVKDSGNFFPGHGGVLDRFDAILFAAPALFCYLILLNL
jgi:phosphatidate cytidylyltransferase